MVISSQVSGAACLDIDIVMIGDMPFWLMECLMMMLTHQDTCVATGMDLY